MQIATIGPWVQTRLRVLLVAILLAGILHILATLAAPRLAGNTPVARLAPMAPLHKFLVHPPLAPQNQPLAFMAPDMRYAMCRYDTAKGPVLVSARLPGRGWALALYTPEGDNFYTAVGQEAQSTDITLQLEPIADRFLGLTPEARGRASEATASLSLTTGKGLVVVRGPDRGLAFAAETEAALKRANCTSKPF